MNNIAHSHFRVKKQGSARACAWYQISNQEAAPREPALRRLLKQALVNKWNPVQERVALEATKYQRLDIYRQPLSFPTQACNTRQLLRTTARTSANASVWSPCAFLD